MLKVSETYPAKNQRGPPVRIPDLVSLRACKTFRVGVEDVVILGRMTEFLCSSVEFGNDLARVPEGCIEYVGDRRLVVVHHFLLQEREIRRSLHAARIGLVRTREHPQQSRLPGAVLADETNPITRCRGE